MRKRLLSEPSRLPLIYHAPESYVSGERIEAFGCLREPLLEEASSATSAGRADLDRCEAERRIALAVICLA
jgi:hypothetical protein